MDSNNNLKNLGNNPWAGLSAYQDPETCDTPLKFCGRKNDSYDVADIIDNNIFVTLYGKSGTGKTSLMNAGVFPLLRKSNYLPVSIRLGTEDAYTSFQKCIFAEIEQAVRKKGRIQTIDAVPYNDDESSTEYLWSYFARNRFMDYEGRVLFPVIVLDQFEEVLRNRYEEVAVLLRQIYFLMDEAHALSDREIDGKIYSYDFNFRFVVAIREDDLYRLEDCIDNNYLMNMKHGRYRLRHLSKKGIRDAILIPGGNLFLENERDAIVDTIINEVDRNHEEGGVSTNLLSLVCSRLFIESQQAGMSHITLEMVDKFVKGSPYEKFYRQATKKLSHRERLYIEQNLVDSDNRRDSVSIKDFDKHVRNADYLFEGDYRILQKVSSSSGGTRVELIHDSFAEHLGALKKKREKTRKMKFWATVATITLLYALAGALIVMKEKQINKQKMDLDSKEKQHQTDSTKYTEVVKTNTMLVRDTIEKHAQINQKDSIIWALQALQLQKDMETSSSNKKTTEDTKVLKNQIEIAQTDADIKESIKDEKREVEPAKTSSNESQIVKQAEQEAPKRPSENPKPINNKNVAENSSSYTAEKEQSFIVDGIEYKFPTPTKSQLDSWKEQYYNLCMSRAKQMSNGYEIPLMMMEDDPCLVYLVLTSMSLETREAKQEWFVDLYPLMNQEQIDKLYDILYREHYKLAEIDDRYKKRQEEIEHKNKELGY